MLQVKHLRGLQVELLQEEESQNQNRLHRAIRRLMSKEMPNKAKISYNMIYSISYTVYDILQNHFRRLFTAIYDNTH